MSLHFEDSLRLYDSWAVPKAIVVDGPYGVAGFPGDPPTIEGLTEWYRPHVAAWTARATPETTLWFWGTEVGWATVHHLFVDDVAVEPPSRDRDPLHGVTLFSCDEFPIHPGILRESA